MKTGEVVCTKCGMVIQVLSEDAPAHPEECLSLYHQRELGSDPRDAKKLKPYIRINSNKDLSAFSNLCDRLQLPDFVKHEAWILYQKTRKLERCTRATCALYAVYSACRNFGFVISEELIRDSIPHVLMVKNVPTTLKALVAFGDATKDIGAAKKSAYCLNVEIASVQGRFTRREDFDLFKRLAQTHYQNLSGNARSRTKKAVAAALSEMRSRPYT